MSGGRFLGGMGGCGTPGIPVALSQAVGPAGPTGIQGNPGPKGDKGDTGLPGINGADGIDGLSAYQLAVAGGFTGSVNEWLLSLIGPQGQQGIAGPAGSQGAQGIAGPTGPTGPVGANGAQGPQGVQGATGAMGATGAAGPQGIKGDQGIQGAPGAAGNGIASIVRTSGTGAPGTTDTYTITFTNATTATFTVYNGANGTGSIASVSATGPLASTGGSNPTISLVQDSNNRLVTDSEKAAWNAKQPAGSYSVVGHVHLTTDVTGLESTLNAKQATLVSGTNIKTVGGANIVGSGNVDSFDINGGTIDGTVIGGSSAAAGSFTTLSASGNATVSGTAKVGTTNDATYMTTVGAVTTLTLGDSNSAGGNVRGMQYDRGTGAFRLFGGTRDTHVNWVTFDNSGAVTIPGSLASGKHTVKQSGDSYLASLGLVVERSTNDTFISLGYDSVSDSSRIYTSYSSTGAYKPLTMWTGDAERMRIDTTGAVTIPGTLSIPTSTRTDITYSTGQLLNMATTTNNTTLVAATGLMNPYLQPVTRIDVAMGAAERNSTTGMFINTYTKEAYTASYPGTDASAAEVLCGLCVRAASVGETAASNGRQLRPAWGLNIAVSQEGYGSAPTDCAGIEVDVINNNDECSEQYSEWGHSYGYWAQSDCQSGGAYTRRNGTAFIATSANNSTGWVNGLAVVAPCSHAGIYIGSATRTNGTTLPPLFAYSALTLGSGASAIKAYVSTNAYALNIQNTNASGGGLYLNAPSGSTQNTIVVQDGATTNRFILRGDGALFVSVDNVLKQVKFDTVSGGKRVMYVDA